jgi:4,5-dihydroxyphthalate decarboxylase
MTRTFSVGCGAYDRTWPLIAATIRVEGAELDWKIYPPEEVFMRGMLGGEFDIAEMSFSSYILQVHRGEAAYTALPIFVSKKFRHGAIYVRSDAGITSPEQLKGRRIGLPEYQLTANVWVRGILADEYGVGPEDVEWVIGGIEDAGREEKIPVNLPARIRARKIGPGETLWAMMTRGELEAIVAPRAPRAFLTGDPRVKRLFRDVKSIEQGYFKKTGVFPPMHIVGIRNDVLDQNPDLPRRLFNAFEKAKRHALEELHQVAYDYAMLPWLGEHLRETEAVMGADYWQYGFANNRKVIELMCRYSNEQGITERHLTPDELFLQIDP